MSVLDEQATDLMPRADEPPQSGDFVYIDVGSIDLTISKGHTRESLEKLHRFIGNLLAQRL